MFIFGNDSAPLFQEDSQAKKVASELFDDDFVSCMDKNVKELDDNLNSYSSLTAANSQIRLNMVQKKNVKAFIQWTWDQYRLGIDPLLTLLSVTNFTEYIKMFNHREEFLRRSSTLTDAAKPEHFKEKIK